MKTINTILLSFLLLGSPLYTLTAQTIDVEAIKSELKEVTQKEQDAFKSGNCEQVVALMAPDITFLANGRKAPSIKMIETFCNAIPRPFKQPISDNLEIHVLSNDVGYTIRSLEYANDETTKMQEYVTKIWKKTDGHWKISHLHSTVKQVSISD